MRKLLQTTLLLVVFIALAKESFAQNLKTKWVQEFETNMDIVDVPLVEGDYVYVHLRKGGDEYGGGKNYLQKRNIKNNQLVGEFEMKFVDKNGNQLIVFETKKGVIEVNSELFVVGYQNLKKDKKGVVNIYKLDKEKMIFDETDLKIELELNKDFINIYPIVYSENFIINTWRKKQGSNFDSYDSRFFRIENNDVKEIKYSEYFSIKTMDLIENQREISFSTESYVVEKSPKINSDHAEYIECISFINIQKNNETNFFGLIRTKENTKDNYDIYVANYDSDLIKKISEEKVNNEDYQEILMNRTVTNLNIYDEFQLNAKKNDLLSVFKIDGKIYFVKIDEKERTWVGSSNPILLKKLGGVQIICIDEGGKFKWDKAIARQSYVTRSESLSYYQMLHGDKLILFYGNSYLVIDVNTGENKIIPNKDFSLQNDFVIKLGSANTDAIVYTKHKESNFGNEQMINVMAYKRNKIQIGLIQFED